MKALNKVVKWGNGGVVVNRDGKIVCYNIHSNGPVTLTNLSLSKMDITQRIWDGPDCYRWRKTFAWWPVKTIKDKYVWFKPIYKQRCWVVWGQNFHLEPEVEYAEILDILTEM